MGGGTTSRPRGDVEQLEEGIKRGPDEDLDVHA